MQVMTTSSKPIKSTTKLVLFYLYIYRNKTEAIPEIRTVKLFLIETTMRKFLDNFFLSSAQ